MFKVEILSEIEKEYARIREKNTALLKEREEKVMQQVPEILEARSHYLDFLLTSLKSQISTPDMSYSETNDFNLYGHNASVKLLLVKNGFAENFLEPIFDCPICKDTGYTGSPIKEKCICYRQKVISKLKMFSNFNELSAQNFDTFNAQIFPNKKPEGSNLSQREYMLQLKELLLEYSDKFPRNERKVILFSGKTGLGKTFLLNCMSKSILDKGFSVIQSSSYNLFNRLFNSYLSGNSDSMLLTEVMYESELLIIDDLGTEMQRNNFTSEDLFSLLNERTAKNLHTFLSTNLSLSDLRERYSDRITSRLFDTTTTLILKFIGDDVRLRQRHNIE